MKHVEVVAAVIMRDDTVFCAQRKDEGETAKQWEFPGGKIEIGETREQALAREIFEEFSTRIKVDEYITTVNHEYNTFSITLHAYRCSVIKGSLTLTEHLDSRWLARDELLNLDWAAADIPIAEQVREMMG